MHIFFDVDYTILGARDYSLRPRTREIFGQLRDDGHDVYVWSGEGERWGVVRTHGLEDLVSGVYGKPLDDYRNRLAEFRVPVTPDFVIDDYPGIVRCFGGVYIKEYFGGPYGGGHGEAAEDDGELDIVYETIKLLAAGGIPDHPRYFPAEG
jgi:hypothetical protein